MKTYIIKRLLQMIPVFFIITIIVFVLINTIPGDPFLAMLELDNVSDLQREAMLDSIGYYDPLPVKYVKWVGNALTGDLGQSIWYNEPVVNIIGRRLSNTLMLAIASLILSVLFAVPLGVISATRKYSAVDYIATIVALIGISIPSFFFGLALIKIFGIDLGWLPVSGMQTVPNFTGFKQCLDILAHMFMPLVVLTFINTATLMRYTRSAMLEVLQQDYIRTARAKGLSEKVVVYRHALRNAMIPLVTMITLSLGTLVSGAVLVETVFTWPGMGSLVYSAITYRDYNLITAGTLLMSMTVLLANLLADCIYAVVDPRIRYN